VFDECAAFFSSADGFEVSEEFWSMVMLILCLMSAQSFLNNPSYLDSILVHCRNL
jgi:hypothetical protein